MLPKLFPDFGRDQGAMLVEAGSNHLMPLVLGPVDDRF
jgi:hypothetical protein